LKTRDCDWLCGCPQKDERNKECNFGVIGHPEFWEIERNQWFVRVTSSSTSAQVAASLIVSWALGVHAESESLGYYI